MFSLKTLTARERAEVRDAVQCVDEATGMYLPRLGTSRLLAVSKALRGWRNFRDASGSEVQWSQERSGEMLDRLAPGWIDELAAEVWRLSHLTEEEKGN